MKKFKPEKNIDRSVIDTFLEDQQQVLLLLERAKSANLEKIKIKSALGSWLMFKLGDAFQFVIAHSERHVLQAQNVLSVIENKEEGND